MSDIGFKLEDIGFYGFENTKEIHRLAVEGEKLWNLLFEKNLDFGGWLVEITGLMGRGKTSLMLEMINKNLTEFPDELLFWREPPLVPLQIAKLNDNFEIFSERKYPLKICELGKTRPLPVDKYKVRYFRGYTELLKMVRPGQVNVVYFREPYRWIELLFRLRFSTEFQSVYIDELEDVCPNRCKDKQFWENERFANHLKEIRKARVNVIYNTQSPTDIDWRIRSKIMMHIYMQGSRGDHESPVYKQMIQSLDVGEAIIDLGFALFGKIRFRAYRPKEKLYAVFPTDNRGRISYKV